MRSNTPKRGPTSKRTTSSKPASRRPVSGRSPGKSTWPQRPKRTSSDSRPARSQGNTRGADSRPSLRPPKRILSPAKKSVMFSLSAPDAVDVSVAGDFNEWEPQPMLKGPDGVWRITVQLSSGTHAYRFLVDGEWIQDPNNPRRQANDMSGYDSVCNVL